MASLLKKSLEDMYQAGEAFTFLMPASESIYLPFDFRTVYEQEKNDTIVRKSLWKTFA